MPSEGQRFFEKLVDAKHRREDQSATIERLRFALQFVYDLAAEELPHAQVGTGAEVALRHIARRSWETLEQLKE